MTVPHLGSVAQSVEQRTENPRVGGSIPSRATTITPKVFDAKVAGQRLVCRDGVSFTRIFEQCF